jgi:hypothetical protein
MPWPVTQVFAELGKLDEEVRGGSLWGEGHMGAEPALPGKNDRAGLPRRWPSPRPSQRFKPNQHAHRITSYFCSQSSGMLHCDLPDIDSENIGFAAETRMR